MIDQTKRERPRRYLNHALSIFEQKSGKVIVEIGSMRMPLRHNIDETQYECCNDGHSSVVLCRACDEFYTVDIDQSTYDLVNKTLVDLGYINFWCFCMDGLEFLRKFHKPIDLLYLDAWDAELDNSAENHLEAYRAAKPLLHSNSLILIDDTDVVKRKGELFLDDCGMCGKGALVIPEAIKDGYRVELSGRQVLLMKD
jgi:hypothetical protein